MSEARTLPIAGKTVLITGGTGGIGMATALGLAVMGARVGITGRNADRAQLAAEEIRAVALAPVDVFVADLSSQAEVRRLAAEALQTFDRLDVLVNNVGGFWNTRRVSADGFEYIFALNHLAPFLLTNLLLDRLKEDSPARVVTVSSGAQAMGRMDFEDLQAERSYSGQRAYNQSKLANVLFTYALAASLSGTGVTANALHPGVVATAFGAEDPGRLQKAMMPLARRWMKTPEQGAQTSIQLASAPELEHVSGQYFANSKPKKTSKRSDSQADADRLWQLSAALVGLDSDSERSTILPRRHTARLSSSPILISRARGSPHTSPKRSAAWTTSRSGTSPPCTRTAASTWSESRNSCAATPPSSGSSRGIGTPCPGS